MQTGLRGRDLIALSDWTNEEIETALDVAFELKRKRALGERHAYLLDKTLAMLFFFSSTRTRASFEAGMAQLGGTAIFLSPRDTQLGRGKPIEDSARVLSRMVDAIMIRTFEHEKVELLARYSAVPVINALTDQYHPCQLLADMLTWFERRGDIQGATVAFIGDGNNMCHSYINAATRFDFHLNIATPAGYKPDPGIVAAAGERISLSEDPLLAARDALEDPSTCAEVLTQTVDEHLGRARVGAVDHLQGGVGALGELDGPRDRAGLGTPGRRPLARAQPRGRRCGFRRRDPERRQGGRSLRRAPVQSALRGLRGARRRCGGPGGPAGDAEREPDHDPGRHADQCDPGLGL